MPDDTSRAAAVTDPKLLELARAGEHWRCGYCASDVRDALGECARCGGGRNQQARAAAAAASAGPTTRRFRAFLREHRLKLMLSAPFGLIVPLAITVYVALRRDGHEGVVRGLGYTTCVNVSRYLPVRREGFAEQRPADATDVVGLGDRVHHHEKVKIGSTQESYQDKVSDGSTTETYSVSEACGETCTSTPQICRDDCTSAKNGFGSCKRVCTGGGKTCKTKYCSKTKTRWVPKYKWVTKTRTVPVYSHEPRYAAYYAWTVSDWVPVRQVVAKGTGNVLPKLTMEQLGLPADTPPHTVRIGAATSPTGWVELEYRHRGATFVCKALDDTAWGSVALGQKLRITTFGDNGCMVLDRLLELPPAPAVYGTIASIKILDLPPPAPKASDAGVQPLVDAADGSKDAAAADAPTD